MFFKVVVYFFCVFLFSLFNKEIWILVKGFGYFKCKVVVKIFFFCCFLNFVLKEKLMVEWFVLENFCKEKKKLMIIKIVFNSLFILKDFVCF